MARRFAIAGLLVGLGCAPACAVTTAQPSVATILFREPTLTVFVAGHTDSKGRDAYNKTLSERRTDDPRCRR